MKLWDEVSKKEGRHSIIMDLCEVLDERLRAIDKRHESKDWLYTNGQTMLNERLEVLEDFKNKHDELERPPYRPNQEALNTGASDGYNPEWKTPQEQIDEMGERVDAVMLHEENERLKKENKEFRVRCECFDPCKWEVGAYYWDGERFKSMSEMGQELWSFGYDPVGNENKRLKKKIKRLKTNNEELTAAKKYLEERRALYMQRCSEFEKELASLRSPPF